MRVLRDLLQTIFKLASFAALIAFVLKVFFVDIYVMPHNGMAPTLIYGDRILIWRRAKPDMGDIVLCSHPTKPEIRRRNLPPALSPCAPRVLGSGSRLLAALPGPVGVGLRTASDGRSHAFSRRVALVLRTGFPTNGPYR